MSTVVSKLLLTGIGRYVH